MKNIHYLCLSITIKNRVMGNQIVYFNNCNNATFVKTIKERQRFPIVAGMPYGTGVKFSGTRKVGYKIVEFTYHLLSDGDKVLMGQIEVKRAFTV